MFLFTLTDTGEKQGALIITISAGLRGKSGILEDWNGSVFGATAVELVARALGISLLDRLEHIDGVESEKIVRSEHSVQGNPEAIQEVKRILHEHAKGLPALSEKNGATLNK
jgi:hypothetical protein